MAGGVGKHKRRSKRKARNKNTDASTELIAEAAQPKKSNKSTKALEQLVELIGFDDESDLQDWANCLDKIVAANDGNGGLNKVASIPQKELIYRTLRVTDHDGTGKFIEVDNRDDWSDIDHYAYFFKRVLVSNSEIIGGIFYQTPYDPNEKFNILYMTIMAYRQKLRKQSDLSSAFGSTTASATTSDYPPPGFQRAATIPAKDATANLSTNSDAQKDKHESVIQVDPTTDDEVFERALQKSVKEFKEMQYDMTQIVKVDVAALTREIANNP